MLAGVILVLLSFIQDYLILIILSNFNLNKNSGFWKAAAQFVPDKFNWLLFGAGMVLILTSILATVYPCRKK